LAPAGLHRGIGQIAKPQLLALFWGKPGERVAPRFWELSAARIRFSALVSSASDIQSLWRGGRRATKPQKTADPAEKIPQLIKHSQYSYGINRYPV
jgi:hypothetical protein